MELKDLVKKEITKKPPRILLYGTHGIGKSSLGASSPNPIFIPTEDGLTNIEVSRFPLATKLADIWEYLGMLINEEHEYKTVVIDTVDWLETLIMKYISLTKQGFIPVEALELCKTL